MGALVERGGRRARAWAFVPALYVLQGLPYFLVETATTTFYAAIGVPLPRIGHASSLLSLPWMLKAAWSPLVDLVGTRRAWTLASQAVAVVAIAALALAVRSDDPFAWTAAACALLALASATADVAADGFYLLALEREEQARFVGVRSACYRLARIVVSGGVVVLAGRLARDAGGERAGWAAAIAAAGALYLAGFVSLAWTLPRPAADRPARERAQRGSRDAPPFLEALLSYFRQPRIAAVVAFVLLFRFGESMIGTMLSPFLIAPRAQGGLAMSVEAVGYAYGTLGIGALTLGGIAGGFLIARFGLRRMLWPMALALHVPNLGYVWAAHAQPGEGAVAALIAVEQLGYGFGFQAYMVFLMQASQRGRYATTHYAVSTALMALAATLARWVSGDLAAALGFEGFFWAVCLASLPGLATLFFVPLEREDAEQPARAAA